MVSCVEAPLPSLKHMCEEEYVRVVTDWKYSSRHEPKDIRRGTGAGSMSPSLNENWCEKLIDLDRVEMKRTDFN